jgi:hypothetical protein
MNIDDEECGRPACGTRGCTLVDEKLFPLMRWTTVFRASRGMIIAPKSIPRHSMLVKPPTILCPMHIVTPLT